MKVDAIEKSSKIQWSIRVVVLITVISAFLSSNSLAKTAREIDTSVDVAIERFHKQVKGAEEYGQGALRIGGKSVDYYNTISGSFGFQIGGESKDIILLFMTDEALENFRASKGWEAGVDGNVALISVGAGGRADTTTLKDPIVGFVFDAKGLIADVSLKGAKFSKLDKKE